MNKKYQFLLLAGVILVTAISIWMTVDALFHKQVIHALIRSLAVGLNIASTILLGKSYSKHGRPTKLNHYCRKCWADHALTVALPDRWAHLRHWWRVHRWQIWTLWSQSWWDAPVSSGLLKPSNQGSATSGASTMSGVTVIASVALRNESMDQTVSGAASTV
jgi:hypothetical protein